jgi:hypothetical protein
VTAECGVVYFIQGCTIATSTGGNYYVTAPSTIGGANFTANSTAYVVVSHIPF